MRSKLLCGVGAGSYRFTGEYPRLSLHIITGRPTMHAARTALSRAVVLACLVEDAVESNAAASATHVENNFRATTLFSGTLRQRRYRSTADWNGVANYAEWRSPILAATSLVNAADSA